MGSKSSKQEPKPAPKPEPKPAPKPEPKPEPRQPQNHHVSEVRASVTRHSYGYNRVSQWQTILPNPQFSRDADEITRNLDSLSMRSVEAPKKSTLNPELFYICVSENVTYFDLDPYHPEYELVTRRITNKRNFKVDGIQRIENQYLEQAFELKRAQKESQFPAVEEVLLFHGTKQAHIDAICEMNFNWRLCQTHKYGRGISFSPNSTYASNYSDKNVHNKVMIVAKVLIGNSCPGNEFMVLPPNGFDTAQKDEGIVIVKFEDNEFYPVYKIDYHLVDENVGRRRGATRHNRGAAKRMQQQVTYTDYDYNYDYNYDSY